MIHTERVGSTKINTNRVNTTSNPHQAISKVYNGPKVDLRWVKSHQGQRTRNDQLPKSASGPVEQIGSSHTGILCINRDIRTLVLNEGREGERSTRWDPVQ